MRLEIFRFDENSKQSISKFKVFDDNDNELADGFMLELPDRKNQNSISRIYEGEYDCVKRYSKKYKNHFHLLNVCGRKYILIHHGNYYKNTRGCLLPGSGLVDIDKDGLVDVVSSKNTMKALYKLLPNKFKVVIKNKMLWEKK